MNETRRIETHENGRGIVLPIFDGENIAPDRGIFAELLEAAIQRADAGIVLGSAFSRPVKGAQAIEVDKIHLNQPGASQVTAHGLVECHRYLPVEGADGQRYGGEDFEKGAWLGGRRAPSQYKRVRVEMDSDSPQMWIVTYSKEGDQMDRVAVPFPQDLKGSETMIRLFDSKLRATQVESPDLDKLLSDHFGRSVRMVRVDEQIEAGDDALPDGVTTKVWGNDGAPLHLLSETSMVQAENIAIEQRGEGASKLPHRPWRPDLVVKGSTSVLKPHMEDEIALWAAEVDGGHVFIQTVRGTPRCAGMQGFYGVVNKYRPKEPRDRRDGLKFGRQRPLFGVNAAVWTESFGGKAGIVAVNSPLIPIAARPKFAQRWEGRWS